MKKRDLVKVQTLSPLKRLLCSDVDSLIISTTNHCILEITLCSVAIHRVYYSIYQEHLMQSLKAGCKQINGRVTEEKAQLVFDRHLVNTCFQDVVVENHFKQHIF